MENLLQKEPKSRTQVEYIHIPFVERNSMQLSRYTYNVLSYAKLNVQANLSSLPHTKNSSCMQCLIVKTI
jgi:hypothetical protein